MVAERGGAAEPGRPPGQTGGGSNVGPFLRSVGVLQVGSLGLTGVAFTTSVLIARLLGPSGFGLYTLVMSVGTAVGLLRRLGQDYAATTHLAEGYVAGGRRRVRDALTFYVVLSVLTSVVVLPPAIVAAPWIGDRFYGEGFGSLLQLYLIQGFWAVIPGWTVIVLQASRRLGMLVSFENATSLVNALLPLALVVAGLGVPGVFYGQILASLIAAGLALVVYSRLQASDPLFPRVGELVAALARPGIELWRETKFGLSIAVDKNLISLASLIPILMLGLVEGESEVGQLRAAISYMAIPAVLLSPVSRLLMVDLPRLRVESPAAVRSFFVRVTLLGGLVSGALALSFALVAWLLVPLLYGSEYGGAPPLAVALLLDAGSLGLGIAAGPIFRSYNRTDLPIRTNLIILLIGLPVAWVAVQAQGAIGAAGAYAGMMLASRLVAYLQCLRILPR